MKTEEIDKFLDGFRETLNDDDRNIFDIYMMKFKGNNYPLCEEEMLKMVNLITTNGENNMEKFMAFGALFFSLFDKFIHDDYKGLNG